jgi:hypothetical protein
MARTIALISILAGTLGLVAATSAQSQAPVDSHVSLRMGDSEPRADAFVDRSGVLVAEEQAVTPEQLAQQETVRRQEFVFTANKAIFDGDRLRDAGELEAAARRYDFALSHLSPGGQMSQLYQRAAVSLAAIKSTWAATAMRKGKYEEAIRLYQEAYELVPAQTGYESDLMRARRKLQETTGKPLPKPSHRGESRHIETSQRSETIETSEPKHPTPPHSRNRIVIPNEQTGVQDSDNLPPPQNPLPATINTRNHIADPTDLLN